MNKSSITIETILKFLSEDDAQAASIGLIEFLATKLGPCKLTDNGFCRSHAEDFPCVEELVELYKENANAKS